MIRDTITDGEDAAFPHHIGTNNSPESGLSKREWFAGMALQGIVQALGDYDDAARDAVIAADLLIEALNREDA